MFSKNIIGFQKLSRLPYFSTDTVSDFLNIKKESASVFCNKYVKTGLFVKIKNNLFITSEKLNNTSTRDLNLIANLIQVPSYVSLFTALAYYNVTSQVQRDYAENVSIKRSVQYEVNGISFRYYRLNKKYYFDFVKSDGIFIATKEKAFIDAVYLFSFGKYKPDFDSLDLNKLDKKRITKSMKNFPDKTKKIIIKICRI